MQTPHRPNLPGLPGTSGWLFIVADSVNRIEVTKAGVTPNRSNNRNNWRCHYFACRIQRSQRAAANICKRIQSVVIWQTIPTTEPPQMRRVDAGPVVVVAPPPMLATSQRPDSTNPNVTIQQRLPDASTGLGHICSFVAGLGRFESDRAPPTNHRPQYAPIDVARQHRQIINTDPTEGCPVRFRNTLP